MVNQHVRVCAVPERQRTGENKPTSEVDQRKSHFGRGSGNGSMRGRAVLPIKASEMLTLKQEEWE